MIRRLFRRRPAGRLEQGARVVTTRTCAAGFFAKGWRGSIVAEDAQGFYLVHFDGGVPRWVEPGEIARIPPRRVSLFQRLVIAWVRVRDQAVRYRYAAAWTLVGALAAYAVPHRIAGIAAGDHPTAHFRVAVPSATSAVRD